MTKPLLFFFLILHTLAFTQNASPELNLNALNYNLIESEFMTRLNKMREEMKLSVLTNDNVLKKAAKDQADYQLEKHMLTHNQTVKNKETPQKRVFYYNGTHDFVGENCIKIPLKKPYKTKYSKKEVEVKTCADAGEALFLGWKNSPGHYKNMITPEYDVSGVSFSFDKDSSYLYAAQVFGAKPFHPGIEYESPADAYGVKETINNICQLFETSEGKNAIKNIQLVMGIDSIYLRSEELNALTKFFNNPADGIYFDLVQRKQFVCEKNNLLHGSPVFDGKMLKPVYFKDIFKRNRARDGINLYASICAIPKQAQNKNVQVNYGIIKNGSMCRYIYPVNPPADNLQMLDLYPKWIYKRDLEVQPDSFSGKLSFRIPFERGETTLSDKKKKLLVEKLEIYKPFITSVDLQTFSSIEGSLQTNLKLQDQRAAGISELISSYTTNKVTFNKQASENWEEFYSLIENTPVSYLKTLSKEKVKEKLKSKPLLDSLDYLLRVNRTAVLTIGIKAYIDNNSNPYLLLAAYKKSIESGDSLKSFTHQNKILEYIAKYQFQRSDLLPVEVPLTRKFLPHLTNYLAVAVKDDELVYSQGARDLALQAYKIDENYLPVKFNCCIMAIRYLQEFNDTIFSSEVLEKNMNECFKLGTEDDSIIVNHMWLNYSILSVYNAWERHQYHNLNKHLLNIKKYYPGAKINEAEAIKLGLLFNNYARYSWTTELLLPYLKNKSKNEDLLYLFVQTQASAHAAGITEQEWEKFIKRASSVNKYRFFKWIDEGDFQLLRQDIFKKEFCEIKF